MKLVKESLNEGRFSCTIEELNKAVNKYVTSKLSSFGDKINVINDRDHILITYTYDITNNIEYLNLSDQEILNRLKKKTLHFKNYFKHFEDFCTSGLRGFVDTFKKDTGIVRINSTFQLDKVKYKTDKDNWHRGERRIYRYSDTGINDINDEKTYVERYGKNDLNILTISVGIFLRTI